MMDPLAQAKTDFARFAKLSGLLAEELEREGFTREEAMSLVRVWFGTSWAQQPVMMVAQALAAGGVPPDIGRLLVPRPAG